MRENTLKGGLSGTWLQFPPHPVGLVLLWMERRGPSAFNRWNGKDESVLEKVLLGPWVLSAWYTEGNRSTQNLRTQFQ